MAAGAAVARKAGNMEDVQAQELARLDEILEQLRAAAQAQCQLLREHLESARISLVGAMPAEYALNLQMAEQALNCISGRNLRVRIEQFIHSACATHEGSPHAREEDA